MSISQARRQSVFHKLERDLRRLSSHQQAQSVHSFRTTTRRLQTLLEQLLPENSRTRNQKKLLKMLARIRKRAGKVRDLDVQLAALRSLKIPQEPRRKTRLMQGLIELRAKHETKLRKSMTKDGIHEIRKRLKRTEKELKPGVSIDPLVVARRTLATVARPAGQLSEDVLHEYRTAVKHARYTAEFAPASTEAERFITEMKRMQDAIGNWQDWLALTNTAANRLGDVGRSSLVAALRMVTGGKFRHAAAALSASPAVAHAMNLSIALTKHPVSANSNRSAGGAQTDSAA